MFQPAAVTEASSLHALKEAIWPGTGLAEEQLRLGLLVTGQLTLVAWQGDEAVGFAAAFPTVTANGQRRWELDLLGVHPAARGQRLGTQLIEAMLRQLPHQPGEPIRALIAVNNIASQTAFRRAGFRQEQTEMALYNYDLGPAGQTSPAVIPAHLVPVQTLNYSGYWLEEIAEASALSLATGLPASQNATLVGALLARDRPDLHTTARQAGYALMGNYHWWQQNGLAEG